VYVYRDTSEPSGHPTAAATEPGADEPDASYWYDLSGEDSAPVPEETRGPFEPLVSSSRPPSDPGPPATPPPSSSTQDPAGTRAMAPRAMAPGTEDGRTAPNSAGENSDENSALGRARRLEQIKDLYLTAEAIGERNVDKHFDELLAQQRELISDYFKQSDAAGPGDGLTAREQSRYEAQAPAGADPGFLDRPGAVGRRPDAPPEASVVADHPRVW
jgi:hypothetical protein